MAVHLARRFGVVVAEDPLGGLDRASAIVLLPFTTPYTMKREIDFIALRVGFERIRRSDDSSSVSYLESRPLVVLLGFRINGVNRRFHPCLDIIIGESTVELVCRGNSV